jgi:hypothetical protein
MSTRSCVLKRYEFKHINILHTQLTFDTLKRKLTKWGHNKLKELGIEYW